MSISLLLQNGLTAQQYPFVQYTSKDGLVNNRARFTFQDSKGRLYISTYGGLSVFDGNRFTNYTTEDGLFTSLVNQIIEMGDDSLWIIPNAHAFHVMVNGKIKIFPLSDHFCPVINQLLKSDDGIYYAFADEGFFRFEKNHFVKIPLIDDKNRDLGMYLSQAVEKDGKLFIITDVNYPLFPGNGKLLVYDLKSKKLITSENLPKFFFIIKSPQKEILLSSIEGVKRIDEENLKYDRLNLLTSLIYPIPMDFVPVYMFFDSQKNLWISSGTGVLKIGQDGTKHLFTTKNGLTVNGQTSIYEDNEKVMWFTNEQTGLTKLANQQFEFYSQIKPGFSTTDIYADKNSDSVWLFDAQHHTALLYFKNTWESFQIPGKYYFLSKIAIEKQNAYLLDQFKIYKLIQIPGKHTFNPTLIYQNPDTVFPFCNPVLDKSGNLITAAKSLSAISNFEVLTDTLGYLADQVSIDKYDQIWVTNRSNKIFLYRLNYLKKDKYQLKHLQTFNKELPLLSPRSIVIDNFGNIWIGSRDHGLYCFFLKDLKINSWKQLTIKDGLSENFISYLYCDADNQIWACSPTGLDKIILKNGNYFIENITRSNNIYQHVRKVQSDRQGITWVLTDAGIIRILPHAKPEVVSEPGVFFTEIRAGNNQVDDLQKKLFLSYQQNDLSFHIASPTFLDDNICRFSYLLEGSINPEWSTPTRQSEINFANLPPGKYTLHARVQFQNGLYPEKNTSFSFEILPPWWKTWWFRLALAATLLLLSFLLIREYVQRRLEKQKMMMEKQQAVERERTRIATDMHDDLGAGLTRIKFLSENIADSISLDHGEHEELEKLKSSSNELVDKMSEIIWAMNEKNNTLADLVFYLRSYAVDYCQENNLVCEFDVPSSIPSEVISGQMRRNIFLVLKESLHNVVKHAVAKKVTISISTGKSIILIIWDDGKGFNNRLAQSAGNGLLNMKSRAEALNGMIKVENQNGTKVMLEIPLLS